ncbi:MAG TPA: NAD-dependent epimerase/dehydratase family protein [Bacteroidales bacterium]|nr:NAD-dependent epimerase/dehydratase family protein [Bacteroidales bacterium]
MIKVGITGQAGFIGTHLYNVLGLHKETIERIPFEDVFFDEPDRLEKFVSACDFLIHLAAMNRHESPEVIYETNMELVRKVIAACKKTQAAPHIIFASSSQEGSSNAYGRSKKEGRELLAGWAAAQKVPFTGMVIPNVFGPFGRPFYNSVIATFCHQLTHHEEPVIHEDRSMELLYVGNLADQVVRVILNSRQSPVNQKLTLPPDATVKVSGILDILRSFSDQWHARGILPDLADPFRRDLFNTFVCYADHAVYFPRKLQPHADERGSFTEVLKHGSSGQFSFSVTRPGITRGNHFHTRKAERFIVIRGSATIKLRRTGTDQILSFNLDGKEPAYVDMPVWFTHNITNTGNEDLYTLFWTGEHFDPDNPDTFYEQV